MNEGDSVSVDLMDEFGVIVGAEVARIKEEEVKVRFVGEGRKTIHSLVDDGILRKYLDICATVPFDKVNLCMECGNREIYHREKGFSCYFCDLEGEEIKA